MSCEKYQLKVIVLGDSGVGKTSLLNRFVKKEFSQGYRATIGSDFLQKEVDYEGQKFSLQLWDTAGQERFQSLGTAFYRGADCCILVYDITSPKSFEHLSNWRSEFIKHSNPPELTSFPFIVLGNKSDRELERVVSFSRVTQWAHDHKMKCFEVSAKENLKVEAAFLEIIKLALVREKTVPAISHNPMKLKRDHPLKKRCC